MSFKRPDAPVSHFTMRRTPHHRRGDRVAAEESRIEAEYSGGEQGDSMDEVEDDQASSSMMMMEMSYPPPRGERGRASGQEKELDNRKKDAMYESDDDASNEEEDEDGDDEEEDEDNEKPTTQSKRRGGGAPQLIPWGKLLDDTLKEKLIKYLRYSTHLLTHPFLSLLFRSLSFPDVFHPFKHREGLAKVNARSYVRAARVFLSDLEDLLKKENPDKKLKQINTKEALKQLLLSPKAKACFFQFYIDCQNHKKYSNAPNPKPYEVSGLYRLLAFLEIDRRAYFPKVCLFP